MRALIYILEGTWWSNKEVPLVLPYFSALASSHRGFELSHRTIRTAADIAHYVGGIPTGANAFVYIACHGQGTTLLPAGKKSAVPYAETVNALGTAKKKPGAVSFVHFGCCEMVGPNRRGSHAAILEATGAKWASGYTKSVDWLRSTFLDLALIVDVFQPFIARKNKMGPKIKHGAKGFMRDYDQLARSLGFSALSHVSGTTQLFPARQR